MAHIRTAKTENLVSSMLQARASNVAIAKALGISRNTLFKHYADLLSDNQAEEVHDINEILLGHVKSKDPEVSLKGLNLYLKKAQIEAQLGLNGGVITNPVLPTVNLLNPNIMPPEDGPDRLGNTAGKWFFNGSVTPKQWQRAPTIEVICSGPHHNVESDPDGITYKFKELTPESIERINFLKELSKDIENNDEDSGV